LLCSGFVLAQTTYRWIDQEGKVHYGDRPPPPKAAREVEQKKFTAPAADKPMSYELREAARNFPATLYVSADCGAACKNGRDYLNKRAIPFSENLVTSSEEIAALRERIGGGDVVVPVLLVGEKTRKGFLESDWASLLDAAGYPQATPQAATPGGR
jgi:hypothetical protein